MRHVAASLALAFLVAACSGTQTPDSREVAVLSFDSNVADAEVWLDGRYLAGALARGVKVEPGAHRVEIRHDDYHTQYFEITVEAGERRTLQVRLAEVLP